MNENGVEVKKITKHNFLIVLVILVCGIFNLFFGEVLLVKNGFGWDGQMYRDIARNFPHLVFEKQLDSYRVQRIVPSGIVHYSHKLLKVGLTDESILMGFKIYNLTLIVLAVYVYCLIADYLKFGVREKWLGFVCLFFNFAIAKQYFYAPASTDQTAFTLGIFMLFFFLKNNSIGLLFLTVIGAFTWPTMAYYGILLYIFPNKGAVNFNSKKFSHYLYSAFLTGALLYLLVRIYFIEKMTMEANAVQVVDSVIYLSFFSVLMYIFFGIKAALDSIGAPNIKFIAKSTTVIRLVVGILTLFLINLLNNYLANGQGFQTSVWVLKGNALSSVVRPFGFLVAHIVYYGPLLLLTIFLWKSLFRIVSQYGVGLVLFILGNFLLSITTESRTIIPSLPFFVIFSIKAIERLRWSSSNYWFIILVSLFFSKIWLLLNTEPFNNRNLLLFPFQYFFMNQGPYMSNQMYIVQGIFILVISVILLAMIKRIIPIKTNEDLIQ